MNAEARHDRGWPHLARLSGDHLVIVREVVADVQRQSGMPEQAVLTIAGEMDALPMMRAAIGAVERVLGSLVDG